MVSAASRADRAAAGGWRPARAAPVDVSQPEPASRQAPSRLPGRFGERRDGGDDGHREVALLHHHGAEVSWLAEPSTSTQVCELPVGHRGGGRAGSPARAVTVPVHPAHVVRPGRYGRAVVGLAAGAGAQAAVFAQADRPSSLAAHGDRPLYLAAPARRVGEARGQRAAPIQTLAPAWARVVLLLGAHPSVGVHPSRRCGATRSRGRRRRRQRASMVRTHAVGD